MERWRITPKEFDEALRTYPGDDELYAWFKDRVAAQDVQRANDWLLRERTENLDRQDSEEGAVAEHI